MTDDKERGTEWQRDTEIEWAWERERHTRQMTKREEQNDRDRLIFISCSPLMLPCVDWGRSGGLLSSYGPGSVNSASWTPCCVPGGTQTLLSDYFIQSERGIWTCNLLICSCRSAGCTSVDITSQWTQFSWIQPALMTHFWSRISLALRLLNLNLIYTAIFTSKVTESSLMPSYQHL